MAAAARGRLDGVSPDGTSSLRSSLASLRTLVAPDGISQMLLDAEFAYASERQAGSRWLARGCRAMGVAYVLLGRPQEAIAVLREGLPLLRDQPELAHVRVACLGYLTFAAAELGDRRDLQRWAVEATWLVGEAHLDETRGANVASSGGARLPSSVVTTWGPSASSSGSGGCAGTFARPRGWRPMSRCAAPGSASTSATLAAPLIRADRGGCAAWVSRRRSGSRPGSGVSRIELGEDGITASPRPRLRVLSFLPTHHSLQEIADRLYLARPTVKTHVASIYEKLGVAGRSEAVQSIDRLGLGSTAAGVTTPDPDLHRTGGANPRAVASG
jgi:hypothetical protein